MKVLRVMNDSIFHDPFFAKRVGKNLFAPLHPWRDQLGKTLPGLKGEEMELTTTGRLVGHAACFFVTEGFRTWLVSSSGNAIDESQDMPEEMVFPWLMLRRGW